VQNEFGIEARDIKLWGLCTGREGIMSSSIVEGITRFMNREQELNNALYVGASKDYTATMWCAKCGERTKVMQACILFAWEPECSDCGTTVTLAEAKVIVMGPDDKIAQHVEEIRRYGA
jgi:hypothetical protein